MTITNYEVVNYISILALNSIYSHTHNPPTQQCVEIKYTGLEF